MGKIGARVFAALLFVVCAQASAQTFPSKAVTLIVPWPPGGSTDVHLRKFAEIALHVPFKGNADSTQALMGGHVMAQSDATGWGRHVDAGTLRLLVTFGEQRTKWNAPTAKEIGIDIVSYSPYGIVGPKGMDAQVVKRLHDAFKRALDDPEQLKVLQQLDQVYWYKSSEEYAQWAAETYKAERATIERVGLLIK